MAPILGNPVQRDGAAVQYDFRSAQAETEKGDLVDGAAGSQNGGISHWLRVLREATKF